MGIDLFRNASPYWDMKMADATDLTAIAAFGGRSVPVLSGFHNRLLRKVKKIVWTDVIEGVSSCTIEFQNLTGTEANHQFFTEGSGAIIYFGYYDFFSFKTTADEIFRGAIKKMVTRYENSGITITCILNCLGVERFTKPALPKIVTGNATSEIAALKNLATFCGTQFALGITNTKVMFKMADILNGNGEWMLPAMKKDGGKERMVTPMDIVKHLARKRGAYWNISDNILYFGSVLGNEKANKLFSYRNTQDDMKYIITHLDYDVFQSFEILDLSSGGLSQGTFAASIDMEKKELPSTAGDTGVTVPNSIDIIVKTTKGLFDSEAISKIIDQGGKYLGKAVSEAKSQLTKLLPNPQLIKVGKIDAIAAASAGMIEYARIKTVGGKIRGALGDPHFRAGSIFDFQGNVDHSGEYVATKVIQTFQMGQGYTMDIESVRPKSTSLTGNPFKQVLEKNLKKLENSGKKALVREIRIQIKQGNDIFAKKMILAALTTAQAAAGGGK